jgi:hypothetical protein
VALGKRRREKRMSKTTDELARIVDEAILSEKKESRDYMGTSGLGSECDRQLWYSYKTPKPVDSAKTMRIFKVGHVLEPVIVEWLRKAGLTVFTEDKNGEQFGFEDGIIAGHIDGVVLGIPFAEKIPHLLEIKTANNFRFKEFVKNGFCSDEKYKTQIHVYMYKMKLPRCLVVVKNKDTSEIYYEIIEIDEFHAISAINRGKEIGEMDEMPSRKYPSKAFFKCQYCNYKPECWSKE